MSTSASPLAHHDVALRQRVIAEFVGTLILGAIVVGSGIAVAQMYAAGTLANFNECIVITVLGLFVLISTFGPISGAHFNPIVTLAAAWNKRLDWADALPYISAQIVGCTLGCVLANVLFGKPAIFLATTPRASTSHVVSEVVATAGLILVVFTLTRANIVQRGRFVVPAYIGVACFFTSSTCFANPAVTIARMFSNTASGIAPASVLPFLVAQMVGGVIGVTVAALLTPHAHKEFQ